MLTPTNSIQQRMPITPINYHSTTAMLCYHRLQSSNGNNQAVSHSTMNYGLNYQSWSNKSVNWVTSWCLHADRHSKQRRKISQKNSTQLLRKRQTILPEYFLPLNVGQACKANWLARRLALSDPLVLIELQQYRLFSIFTCGMGVGLNASSPTALMNMSWFF